MRKMHLMHFTACFVDQFKQRKWNKKTLFHILYFILIFIHFISTIGVVRLQTPLILLFLKYIFKIIKSRIPFSVFKMK